MYLIARVAVSSASFGGARSAPHAVGERGQHSAHVRGGRRRREYRSHTAGANLSQPRAEWDRS